MSGKRQKSRLAKFTLRDGEAWYAGPWRNYGKDHFHTDADYKTHKDRVLFALAGPCDTIDAAIRALVDDDAQAYDVCYVFKGPKSGDLSKVSKVSFLVEIGTEKA